MSEDEPFQIVIDTEQKLTAWNKCPEEVISLHRPSVSEEAAQNRFLVLRGKAAMHLWRQGKDAWNQWVKENPVADIDFFGEKFEPNSKFYSGQPFVDFIGFRFPEGEVSFFMASFVGGDACFAGAKFDDGLVDFSHAKFDDHNASFTSVSFGKSIVDFRSAHFEGTVHFLQLDNLKSCSLFSFEGAHFEKLFRFSHLGRMGAPLDLRRARLSHGFAVQDIRCDFFPKASPAWSWAMRSADREDSQRFRRLKELAIANRNHAKALEFHVQEIRTKRGHETNWLQDLAQFVFWAFGDYGRSWLRPLSWIAALCLGFATWFWNMKTPISKFADKDLAATAEASRDFLTALTYSASNMLSFIPTGRTAKQQGEELLFGGTVPDEILLLSGSQSILAVILLFLLGLGLRNLFRV